MFFLYHSSTRPTGQLLSDALDIPGGTETPDRHDVLIRWGAQQGITYRPELPINRRDAIRNASSKFESLEIMREAGVPTPRASTSPNALRAPFLGRDFSHSQGRDIVLCMQLADAVRNPKEYYVEYIPTAREYRVHVAFGECIKVSEKVSGADGEHCPWIRNVSSGYTFRNPRVRLGSLGQAAAIDAVRGLGLDFGAVDLIIGDDANTYVLEVNTAPACATASTAIAYAEAFQNHLQELGHSVVANVSLIQERLGSNDETSE